MTSRLGKGLDKLAEFKLATRYKPVSANIAADRFSRRQDYVGAVTMSAGRAQREREELENTTVVVRTAEEDVGRAAK